MTGDDDDILEDETPSRFSDGPPLLPARPVADAPEPSSAPGTPGDALETSSAEEPLDDETPPDALRAAESGQASEAAPTDAGAAEEGADGGLDELPFVARSRKDAMGPPREPNALDRRPWTQFIVAFLFVAVIAIVLPLLAANAPAPEFEVDRGVGGQFVDGLRRGTAPDPDTGENGYSISYEQLTAAAQERTPFGAFVAVFDDRVDRLGLLLYAKRRKRDAGTRFRRVLIYDLTFAGSGREDEKAVLTIELVPSGDSYRVDDFRIEEG